MKTLRLLFITSVAAFCAAQVSSAIAARIYHARQLIWEVPRDARSVVVEIFNADNSFENSYTITNYITIKGGQKIRITAK